ncbi:MAG: hypothetical protein ABSF50_05510 [Burkholderiaceae bacterium]|jgi:hypothetical protein
MALSKSEADLALQAIAQTEVRSHQLAGYERASPHVILWGVIWAVAYALEYWLPAQVNLIWGVLGPLGFVASLLIARRTTGRSNWRVAAGVCTILLFVIALFAVVGPATVEQIAAINGLVLALVYAVGGLVVGSRFIAVAVMLAIAMLVGYFLLGSFFLLWMSFFGGGALVLAGFWLKKV